MGTGLNGIRSETPWPSIVTRKTGEKVDNNAIPGTCMAQGKGYGTNDYGYVIELGSTDDDNKKTFRGALNYVLKKIANKHPKLKVVLLTPMW